MASDQNHEKYHIWGTTREKETHNGERSRFQAVRRKTGECCNRGLGEPKVAEKSQK